MALRDVYYLDDNHNVKAQRVNVKWAYHNDDLVVQRLHQAFMKSHPKNEPLEISSASKSQLGYWASATKMPIRYHGANHTVEQVFQAGKVYNGRPMTGALNARVPKRYVEAHQQGKLQGFQAFGHKFSLKPTTMFYDWVYLHSLQQMPAMMKSLRSKRAFTDIFAKINHPNTQAKACALFNSIVDKRGMKGFNALMDNPKAFQRVDAMVNHDDYSKKIQAQVYEQNTPKTIYKQYPKGYRFDKNPNNNKIMQVNALATRFYHHVLMDTHAGEPARKYLHGRQVSDKMMNEYQLGFAPRGSQLKKYLKKHGVSGKLMREAGLSTTDSKTGKAYDKFFSRIMYPINNRRGDAIAFSGRVLNKNDAMAKYMNTPETNIFQKSKTIFNLDKAHQSISKHNRAFLMEGYMDVMSAHQAGVNNAIASMGTSLTKQQIGIIKGLTNRVTVCYDGDRPGQDAINRAMKMLKGTGLQRSVVQMPKGIDPDEYRRKYGVAKFRKYMATHIESPRSFKMDYGYRILTNPNIEYTQAYNYMNKLIPMIATSKSSQEKELGAKMLSQLHSNGKPIGMDRAKKTVNSYVLNQRSHQKHNISQARWRAGMQYYRGAIWSVAHRDGRSLNDKQVSVDLMHLINKYKKSGLTKPIYSIGSDNKQHKENFPTYMDAVNDEYLVHTSGLQALDNKYHTRMATSYIAQHSHDVKSYNHNLKTMLKTPPALSLRHAETVNKAVNQQYEANDRKAVVQDMKAQDEYLKQHPSMAKAEQAFDKEFDTQSKATHQGTTSSASYTMYCDGGCRNTGNQHKGGHAHSYDKSAYAFLITKDGHKIANGTQGYYGKTNNRMEIQAVLAGLRCAYKHNLADKPLRIVSDSKYVDNAINQHWLKHWALDGFTRKGDKTLSNADQWATMHKALSYFPQTSFHWTKGHSTGQTADSRGNIYVDHLLNKTMDKLPAKQPEDPLRGKVGMARVNAEMRMNMSNFHEYEKSKPKPVHSESNHSHISVDGAIDKFEGMNNQNVRGVLQTYGVHNRAKALKDFESIGKYNPHDKELNDHIAKLKALKGHKYVSDAVNGSVHAISPLQVKNIEHDVKPYVSQGTKSANKNMSKYDALALKARQRAKQWTGDVKKNDKNQKDKSKKFKGQIQSQTKHQIKAPNRNQTQGFSRE